MEFVAGVLVFPVFHSHLGVHEIIRFKDVQRLKALAICWRTSWDSRLSTNWTMGPLAERM